ncbi:membrane lipoprotein lipid attachment site-containing protein [Dysgonomonas sp. OttesenSCG-928-M03]|nr:membrane lipoprotein lipid attachment site-containing protein [Dysgonomonas sp. OttesenSCG-928-M03]
MKKLLTLLSIVLILASCSSDDPNSGGSTNITGSWKFDRLDNTIDIADDLLRKDIERWMNDARDFYGTSITFNRDGSFIETGAKGKYYFDSGALIMCYEDKYYPDGYDCGDPDSKPCTTQRNGNTLVLIINHTERYKSNNPSAGVVSVIERRYYTLKN